MKDLLLRLYTRLDIKKYKICDIDLNQDFQNIIFNTLTQYKKAQKIISKYLIYAFIVFILLPLIMYLTNESLRKNQILFIVTLMPIYLFATYFFMAKILHFWTNYVDFFKANFIKPIIMDIDKNFIYQYEKIRELDETFNYINLHEYSYKYSQASREDYINGKYDGVYFEFTKIYRYMKDSIPLDGVILMCDFEKNIDLDLKIINNKIKFSKFFKMFNNVSFDKFFSIKSDNYQNTDILTLDFKEKLIQLNQSQIFGHMSLAFKNNKVYIILETNKTIFEPYILFKPSLKLAKFYKAEFLEILSIISELKPYIKAL